MTFVLTDPGKFSHPSQQFPTHNTNHTHPVSFLDCQEEEDNGEETMTDTQFANLESTHNEIIGRCNFNETDFIPPSHIDDSSAVQSNITHPDTNRRNNNNYSNQINNRSTRRNFNTLLEIFRGAAGGFTTY